MTLLVFIVFACVTVGGSLTVVASRSPVVSAVGLVTTMSAIAALYVLLGAYFVGVVQVIVYAGAIVVLFLFVIMLLNVGSQDALRERFTGYTWLGVGLGVLFAIAAGISVWAIVEPVPAQVAQRIFEDEGHTVRIAKLLFRNYLLPFEIISLILLASLVGVTLLIRFHGHAWTSGDEE